MNKTNPLNWSITGTLYADNLQSIGENWLIANGRKFVLDNSPLGYYNNLPVGY